MYHVVLLLLSGIWTICGFLVTTAPADRKLWARSQRISENILLGSAGLIELLILACVVRIIL